MDLSELEQLQLEVMSELCVLSRDILVELCDFPVIAGPKFEHVIAKIWTALIMLISNYIQREELEQLGEKEMSDLLNLKCKISALQVQAIDQDR